MNDLLSIDFGIKGQTLKDVIMRPDNYPVEIVAAYMDAILAVSAQIREARIILEAHLLNKMAVEGATKLLFKSIDGRAMIATRKNGPVKCEIKNADEVIKDAGFDPLIIGNYKFDPSWTKAKEIRKLGGDIQKIVDELFIKKNDTISITQN